MKSFKTASNILISILLLARISAYAQNPINKNSVRVQSMTTATVVGDNGRVFQTTNAGLSWNVHPSNITNTLRGNDIYDANISFAVGDNGVIIRTTDGGNNWLNLPSPVAQNLNDIYAIHQWQSEVACGDHGKIIISNNNGDSWSETASGDTNSLRQIIFIDSNIGFIVGSNSTLLKTTDRGNTWNHLYLGFGTFQFTSIAARSESIITLVGANGMIMNTCDGGNSWYTPNGPVYQVGLNSIVYFEPSFGIITGDQGVILRTTDGGSNWDPVQVTSSSPAALNLKSVSFSPVNMAIVGMFGIIVGDSGVTYCSTDFGATWYDFSTTASAREHVIVKQTNVSVNQNFPNPFNPSTVISYNLPYTASVSLKVYDMLGKEVKTLVNSEQVSGEYNYRFDGSGLSSGIYFYVLRASGGSSNFSKTMRMILTK